MIKIQIEDQVYDFPQSWSEITLGQYLQIAMIPADMYPIKRAVRLISVLGDIYEGTVERISIEDIIKIDLSWIDKPISPKPQEKFIIDGKDYMAVNFKKLTPGGLS